MNLTQLASIEALRNSLRNLEETIRDLHTRTLEMPHDEAWNNVRDSVSCLDSTADVMRQVLHGLEGKE